MTLEIKIAPSILSANFSRLGEEVKIAEEAGADLLHVDIMDGNFVPNLSMGPQVVKAIRSVTSLPFDVHLMVNDPQTYSERFIEAGADIIDFHIEVVPDPLALIRWIQEREKKVGISLNPDTEPEKIRAAVSLVDRVLIMTVFPGFGGQRYIESANKQIAAVKQLVGASGREIDIVVDGGIQVGTARQAARSGANVFVAGSAVYGAAAGVVEAVRAIRKDATAGSKEQ